MHKGLCVYKKALLLFLIGSLSFSVFAQNKLYQKEHAPFRDTPPKRYVNPLSIIHCALTKSPNAKNIGIFTLTFSDPLEPLSFNNAQFFLNGVALSKMPEIRFNRMGNKLELQIPLADSSKKQGYILEIKNILMKHGRSAQHVQTKKIYIGEEYSQSLEFSPDLP
ncbi:MAG: hypothetical protein E7062_04485 [Spirochaetaceae bacterium]|nr:hypothetical protein [Spirochaetaceae bacterium]